MDKIVPRIDQKTREKSWKRLKRIEVKKIIAPFGLPREVANHLENIDKEKKIITRPKQEIPIIRNTEYHALSKIHTKMWLGEDEAVIGSWNFYDNKNYELCYFIENEDKMDKLENHFDKLWEKKEAPKHKCVDKIKDIEKHLNVLKKILLRDESAEQKIERFKEKTGKSRSTYYRYKDMLEEGEGGYSRKKNLTILNNILDKGYNKTGREVKEFKRKTGKSRSTYYRYKDMLEEEDSRENLTIEVRPFETTFETL